MWIQKFYPGKLLSNHGKDALHLKNEKSFIQGAQEIHNISQDNIGEIKKGDERGIIISSVFADSGTANMSSIHGRKQAFLLYGKNGEFITTAQNKGRINNFLKLYFGGEKCFLKFIVEIAPKELSPKLEKYRDDIHLYITGYEIYGTTKKNGSYLRYKENGIFSMIGELRSGNFLFQWEKNDDGNWMKYLYQIPEDKEKTPIKKLIYTTSKSPEFFKATLLEGEENKSYNIEGRRYGNGNDLTNTIIDVSTGYGDTGDIDEMKGCDQEQYNRILVNRSKTNTLKGNFIYPKELINKKIISRWEHDNFQLYCIAEEIDEDIERYSIVGYTSDGKFIEEKELFEILGISSSLKKYNINTFLHIPTNIKLGRNEQVKYGFPHLLALRLSVAEYNKSVLVREDDDGYPLFRKFSKLVSIANGRFSLLTKKNEFLYGNPIAISHFGQKKYLLAVSFILEKNKALFFLNAFNEKGHKVFSFQIEDVQLTPAKSFKTNIHTLLKKAYILEDKKIPYFIPSSFLYKVFLPGNNRKKQRFFFTNQRNNIVYFDIDDGGRISNLNGVNMIEGINGDFFQENIKVIEMNNNNELNENAFKKSYGLNGNVVKFFNPQDILHNIHYGSSSDSEKDKNLYYLHIDGRVKLNKRNILMQEPEYLQQQEISGSIYRSVSLENSHNFSIKIYRKGEEHLGFANLHQQIFPFIYLIRKWKRNKNGGKTLSYRKIDIQTSVLEKGTKTFVSPLGSLYLYGHNDILYQSFFRGNRLGTFGKVFNQVPYLSFFGGTKPLILDNFGVGKNIVLLSTKDDNGNISKGGYLGFISQTGKVFSAWKDYSTNKTEKNIELDF